MRIALVFLAACSGGLDIDAPRGPLTLRLIECAPAQPLFVEVDGRVTTHGRLDGSGMGWASGTGAPKRAATMSFGMPTTSGMMDAMLIRKTITTRMSDLTRCYEKELQNSSTTRHSIAWRFSVAQDGRVLYADPMSRAMTSATNECISRIFRELKFPVRTSGGTITVTQPLVFDAIPIAERKLSPIVTSEYVAWTPFAVGAFAPERATTVARATESAMRGRAEKLEGCFKQAPKASGSLRAVLGVQADGNVAAIRAGGLGEAALEKCVETELAGVKVVNPMAAATEITCDFARGDAQPWRVSPTEHYGVIDVTKRAVTYGKNTLAAGAQEPTPLIGDKTYLIAAEPDAPGAMLSNALAWASEGDASLVALRDSKGAPIYLGMGRAGFDDSISSRPMLVLSRGTVQACIGTQAREGKLSEAGVLALKLAKRCKSMRCGALVVGIDDLALARDLVEVTSAARRAGFERVLIGGRVECEKQEVLEDDDS